MTKIESRIRNYVSTHKKGIAATVIATAVIVLQGRAIKSYDAFLEEKDLLEEFYGPDDFRVVE